MNKKEVLSLVDSIMHEFASSFRSEAEERVVEKFTAPNIESVKCNSCSLSLGKNTECGGLCVHNPLLIDMYNE